MNERKRRKRRNSYMYEGKEYVSLSELCDSLGVSYLVISKRVRRGFTIKQALDKNFISKYGYDLNNKSVRYKGVNYPNLKVLAKKYNLTLTELSVRLETGYSLDYALTKYKKVKSIRFRGREYKNQTELAKAFNVPLQMLRDRLKHGWSLEQALGVELPPSGVSYKGVGYPSVKKLCESFNKDYILVSKRLYLGWSLERALEEDVVTKDTIEIKRKERKEFNVNGKRFKSIAEVAKYYNISYSALYSRLKHGFTVDQAVDPDFRKKYGSRRKR